MKTPTPWHARLILVLLVATCSFQACVARLYRLQINEGAIYRHRALLNTVADELTPAPRGRIIDARGQVLVLNEPRYAVTARPLEIRDVNHTAQALAAALGWPTVKLEHRLRRWIAANPGDRVVVARSLTPAALARVAEILPQLPGIQVEVTPQRRYPQGTLAAHVLGFVGDITEDQYRNLRHRGYHAFDVVGQSGLEAYYDSKLRGQVGVQELAVDATGHAVASQSGRPAAPGADLVLSLDARLQAHAEHDLQVALDRLYQQNGERSSGAVVMLSAQSGRVLAMASLPDFNPGIFAHPLSDQAYRTVVQNPMHPLLSRAFQSAWPSGSTFKPLEACACLQCGICTATSIFYCTGEYRGFHCFVRSGHGRLNFTEAIAQSCDATFYMLGDRLGIHRMDRFAHAFGLGQRSGLDLPDEEGGLFATPAWKQQVYHQPWQWYDTINMSIGQGLMVVTPLQMAVAIAAIANGGYIYRPHLVDRIVTRNHQVLYRYHPRPLRRLPIRPQYFAAVRQGMAAVVDHGTGVAAKSPIVSIAGKTGTAEAVPTVYNPHGRNHTWFVAFAPVDKPQVVAVVMLEKSGGYGGGQAAPIARDCIEYWYQHRRHR